LPRIEEFPRAAPFHLQRPDRAVNKRLSQNYQFLASYTLGKVIDDNPDATSVVPFSGDDAKMLQDPLNSRGDRSAGVNDQRHRLVLSAIWDLDSYARPRPFVRYLVGGWQLSGILMPRPDSPTQAWVNSDLNKTATAVPTVRPGSAETPSIFPTSFRSILEYQEHPITERVKAQLILEATMSSTTQTILR